MHTSPRVLFYQPNGRVGQTAESAVETMEKPVAVLATELKPELGLQIQ
jgi:hypothetical protein